MKKKKKKNRYATKERIKNSQVCAKFSIASDITEQVPLRNSCGLRGDVIARIDTNFIFILKKLVFKQR